MTPKRILVHGAGGSPAANYIRSLRISPEKFFIIGIDTNKYNLMRSEADKNYLMPAVSDPNYKELYFDLIEKEKVDFIHSQIDQEIPFLSRNREFIKSRLFLPAHEAIEVCQNKLRSYEAWMRAGITVPSTVLVRDESDLSGAFKSLGPKLWIREIFGSAGRNSLPTDDFALAKVWITYHNGWGKFTASECLTPESVTWMSIWKDGELIIAQTRKRIYWESSNRSPSGVTGITGTGITVSDPKIDEIAIAAIRAVEKKPNGIHSVDMTYDKNGVPNPTENNIGRFFTTHYFFAKAGCNMAYIYTKIGLNEQVPKLAKKINPLPDGLAWIRGVDVMPILTTFNDIERNCAELENRRKGLQ